TPSTGTTHRGGGAAVASHQANRACGDRAASQTAPARRQSATSRLMTRRLRRATDVPRSRIRERVLPKRGRDGPQGVARSDRRACGARAHHDVGPRARAAPEAGGYDPQLYAAVNTTG